MYDLPTFCAFDADGRQKVRRDIPEDGEVLGDPRYYARAGMVPDVLRQYWNTWVIHEMKKRYAAPSPT